MNYKEIEMDWMKEILRDKEEEIKKLKADSYNELQRLWLENYELREEIKKLKSDLSLVIKERDDNIEQNKKLKDDLLSYIRRDEDLREENKKLSEENGQLKADNEYRKKIADIIPQDEKSVAEETIKDLQERIRFLEQCLDNKEKVNKSLREENKRLSDFLECES